MRDITRIERICLLLKEKWEEKLDQRLGQFLLNYIFNDNEISIFYTEDIKTEEKLRAL